MKRYCCRHCGRILFEGSFIGVIKIICRKCHTTNIYENK